MSTKKLIICSLAIITIFGIGFGLKINSHASNINRINFPVIGGELPADAEIQLDSSATFSDEKIKPGKADSVDQMFRFVNTSADSEKTDKLRKVFGLENAKKTVSQGATIYENNKRFLRISDDGTFVYHNKSLDSSSEINLSDDECKRIAKDFLKKNDLATQEFFENGIAHVTKTNALNPNDSKILGKDVYFNRKIDNKMVYGIARVIISIGQDGQVASAYSAFKNYSKGEPVCIKSFDKAFEDLKKLDGMIDMDPDTKKVSIKKVELVYWEDSSPNSKQTHIQPIYHFLGETLNQVGNKGTFEGFIAAVPDNLTTPVEQPDIKTTLKIPKETHDPIPPREKPDKLK